MEQPRIERMLRLMKLMSGNTNYTIGELAKKLGITYRSVYRYIDTFENSGFVVDKVRKNVYKLGKMPKGLVELDKLIYFSEEEAYIVNSLINGLDATNALKADLHKKLTAVFQCTSIGDYIEDKNCAANIEMLGQAIREKKKVILKNYESGNSKQVADRLIEPYEFTRISSRICTLALPARMWLRVSSRCITLISIFSSQCARHSFTSNISEIIVLYFINFKNR